MTASPPISHSTRFVPLEQADFQRLEHAGYLKGLLQPFKGKGSLETWASQCSAARRRDRPGAAARAAPGARLPLHLLDVQLAQQTTGAGTTFLRWRNLDRSSMGVALWEALLANPATPASLIDDLYAIELQRIVLNMQISLTHSIARQALECASKAAQAEAAYLRRVHGHTASVPHHHQGVTMSTHFVGEGNIGSAPDYREFPNGNDEPRRLLRLNVYFDNPIPKKDGEYEDRGGFWAPVELWHRDAEHWKTLYQKGMRVLVEGRTVRDEWEDADENERVTFKIEARRVGILPYRIESVTLSAKPAGGQ
jgi:single-stranded DNA-binding protein